MSIKKLLFCAIALAAGSGCQLLLVPEEKPAARLELVTWGTNRFENAYAVALNPSGHIFITGTTLAGMDGQPYLGLHDVFLTHLDADGIFQGTIQWGTDKDDVAFGIAADGGGNVYVAGYTTGTLSGQSAAGVEDAFLVKFESNGSQDWIRQFGTAGKEIANAVAVDRQGNSYVVGQVSGSLHGQPHAGQEDAFLVKFDQNGNRVWTQQWGTAAGDAAVGIGIDFIGNIYVAGATNAAMDGQEHKGNADIFICRFNSAGQRAWTKQVGTAYDDNALAISPDFAGSVFVTGYVGASFDGNVYFSGFDAVLLKIDGDGNLLWSRQFGSSGDDKAFGVVAGANRRVHVVGIADGALDGQTPLGGTDIFVRQYDSGGVEVWTQQLGSSGDDTGNAIAIDSGGRIYITGAFTGPFRDQTPIGESDVFLLFSE